ncbi:hypothetical protein FS749_015123 [Ceratobasidium sp. UAMH 11750]|nr:hypothetical protein FS749_015123 [Ceratobasidium sp. UAMH 11750]
MSAIHGDEAIRSIQSSFRHEESETQSGSPQQLSPFEHVSSSDISTSSDNGPEETPMSHKVTKRDKLAGKVGKAIAKLTHDPELHDRAMLREIGGKEAAEGLTMVDSSSL